MSSILLMGDSHMRNLFSAFVAGLRGVKYGIEGHTEARAKSNSGLVFVTPSHPTLPYPTPPHPHI